MRLPVHNDFFGRAAQFLFGNVYLGMEVVVIQTDEIRLMSHIKFGSARRFRDLNMFLLCLVASIPLSLPKGAQRGYRRYLSSSASSSGDVSDYS
jgi:hypothetical protein